MKWYRKTKFIHLPAGLWGYILDLLIIVFLITVFVAVDRDSHSVSDTFYGIFPYFVATFLLREWLAPKLRS